MHPCLCTRGRRTPSGSGSPWLPSSKLNIKPKLSHGRGEGEEALGCLVANIILNLN